MLKSDQETKLADFMRENMITVDEDVPAIQLAKLFLVHNVQQILVTPSKEIGRSSQYRGFCHQTVLGINRYRPQLSSEI